MYTFEKNKQHIVTKPKYSTEKQYFKNFLWKFWILLFLCMANVQYHECYSFWIKWHRICLSNSELTLNLYIIFWLRKKFFFLSVILLIKVLRIYILWIILMKITYIIKQLAKSELSTFIIWFNYFSIWFIANKKMNIINTIS